jgi:hypothetical protein
MEYEESIYNLIPKERYEPPKGKMHKSKHPHDVPPTATTFGLKTTSKPGVGNLNGDYQPQGSHHSQKAPGATFGQPKGALKPDTQTFRKKGTGTMVLPESKLEDAVSLRVLGLSPQPNYNTGYFWKAVILSVSL